MWTDPAKSQIQCLELHGVGGFAVEGVHDCGGVLLNGGDVFAVEEDQPEN